MAKNRMVNTRFWIDDYISGLDPIEKLLFLYLLTNPYTEICGVYEIPLKLMAVETGIDIDMVKKVIGRFQKDGRVKYKDGWIAIKNFIKHQAVNPKVEKGIELGLERAPRGLTDSIYIGYSKPIDSLSHSNSNLNSNSNPNASAKAGKKPKFNLLGEQILKAFEGVDPKNKTYYGNTTQRKACDFLISEYGLDSTLSVIAVLPEVNKQKLYVAQVTTPHELQQNWVKLANAVGKKLTSKKIVL